MAKKVRIFVKPDTILEVLQKISHEGRKSMSILSKLQIKSSDTRVKFLTDNVEETSTLSLLVYYLLSVFVINTEFLK